MEASPQFVSHDKIYKNLLSLPNVVGIHSLRVWALKSDTLAATVHLELEENSDANKVSIMAQYLLAKIHRIRFSTVQVIFNLKKYIILFIFYSHIAINLKIILKIKMNFWWK